MKIGILDCDTLREPLQAQFGRQYSALFKAAFHTLDPTLTFATWSALDGELPEDLQACDAWLITGSKHDAFADTPWIQALRAWIRRAYAAKVRLVGVCFGHQAIAAALGGQVARAPVGWSAGYASYALLARKGWMPPQLHSFDILNMHRDQVLQLPPGLAEDCTLLAGNVFCPHYSYQIGDHILGIQGHPEFSKAYQSALLAILADTLGPDISQAAQNSLNHAINANLVLQGVLNFMQNQTSQVPRTHLDGHTHQHLVVELCVEELPPKALFKLGEAFAQTLLARLQALGLCAADVRLRSFASPRRLACSIAAVRTQGPEHTVEQRLMPVSVGLKDGAATPALLKKMQALGLEASAVSQLERVNDGKADILVHRSVQAGMTLAAALQQALQESIAKLPIPKVMSYQLEPTAGWRAEALNTVQFVRPAHALLALHGAEVVPVHVLGLQAGRSTLGHRFEAAQNPLVIAHADDWESTLENVGAVIPCFHKRRARMLEQLATQAQAAGAGLKPVEDAALVDEVTALVERPNVVRCSFEPEFLQLPQECLILTMKANQKYFPLLDSSGHLSPHFLVVSNLSPADTRQIVQGNERVVRPRLADARFFFEQDRSKTLAQRLPGLAKVVYHNQLGSQADRSERVRQLCHIIVQDWRDRIQPFTADVREHMEVLANKADEAARLAKADLLTGMVGEFPELQGVMGAHYARLEGLRPGVAQAIEDQYRPRFAGDSLPRNYTGLVLAMADKLETLIGMFGIGNLPSGERDPYALRRHALGVLRMLVEKAIPIHLPHVLTSGAAVFGGLLTHADQLQTALSTFMHDRLANWLREQGYESRVIDAVLALDLPQLHDVRARLDALQAFTTLPQAADLSSANKRIQNILRKNADAWQGQTPVPVDAEQLVADEEKTLLAQLRSARPEAEKMLALGQYSAQLHSAAGLAPAIAAFFDQVMVMSEDLALRQQRLALLHELRWHMEQVGDMARLQG